MNRFRASAAYRALVNAAPGVDLVDRRGADYKAKRLHVREMRAAEDWATDVDRGTCLYATDGSARFYRMNAKKTHFLPGYSCLGRLATSAFGESAAAIYVRHQGEVTDRRPSGWVSAATLAAARYGGFDGDDLKAWGWKNNADIDLDIDLAMRLRGNSPMIRGHLSEFAEHLERAMARA